MEFVLKYKTEDEAHDEYGVFLDFHPFTLSSINGRRITIYDDDNPRFYPNKNVSADAVDPVVRLSNADSSNMINGRFTDIELNVTDPNTQLTRPYQVHRVMLWNNSDFFANLLDNKWSNRNIGNITYDHSLFDVVIKAIYGSPVLLRGSEGVYIVMALTYFAIKNIDTERLIDNFDVPQVNDFKDYLEALNALYGTIPKKLNGLLTTYMDFYEDQPKSWFRSFWDLIPPFIQNRYKTHLEEPEESEDRDAEEDT